MPLSKNCKNCNNTFLDYKHNTVYCSPECRIDARGSKVKNCANCGKAIYVKKDKIKPENYCSKECYNLKKRDERKEKCCQICESKFTVTLWNAERICCSKECQYILKKRNAPALPTLECGFCKTAFQVKKRYEVNTRKYCSRKCMDEGKKSQGFTSDGLKICSTCKEPQQLEGFPNDILRREGKRQTCLKCLREKSADYVKKNPLQARKSKIQAYGISITDFDRMIKNQKNKCAICGEVMQKPFIDHCHASGKVRGLLCIRCNSGLGMFKDNPENLTRAILYLQNKEAQ